MGTSSEARWRLWISQPLHKRVREDLGGERIWGLDDKDTAVTVEAQGVGVPRHHQARVPLPRRRQVVAKFSQGMPT